MPKGIKGFQPGQSGNPLGKPKGTKNAETLLKEERRAVFERKASEKWEQIIDQLPPTYVADQFMGKAPEKIDLNAKVENTLTEEVLALAEEELKKRKLNDQ